MNSNESKFSSGFLMGLIVGGGAVFLLGTRTGRNLVKIVSEQGLDGLLNLLEEYGLEDIEEEESSLSETPKEDISNEKTAPPKRRFFKRVRR